MVYARFTPALTNVTTNKVTQWDYGRILRIEGLKLPTAVRIDFGISGSQTTISRIGITKDGVTDAAIPDSLLEQSKNLVAYVYVNDTKEGKTVRTINIPLEARAKPEEHDSPESKELFAEAIEMINDVAGRAENAEITAKEHADSAKESLESTQRISSNFNETAANAVKAVIDAGTSQIQAVNNTRAEALKAIQAEGAAQLEHIQAAGEVIVNAAAIAEQNAKNVLANAIKGNLSGEIVTADDVSPIEHEMAVKVVCPDGIDPATVKVRRCGKNIYDNNTIADKYVETIGYRKYKLLLPNGVYTWSLKENTFFGSGCYAIWTDDEIYEGGVQNSNCFYNWIGNSGVERECPANGIFTVTKGYAYLATTGAVNGKITEFIEKFTNMQLEKGSTATNFEAFKVMAEHTPASDGTVSGMMSASPNMTILTDTEGVLIECEYIKDTNKVIQKLADALGVVI